MMTLHKRPPLVIAVGVQSAEDAMRVLRERQTAVDKAILANEALFHTQQELEQTQEDLRLAQWRVDDARRQGTRAEARARCYAWAAWIFAGAALMEAVLLWRAA